MASTDRSTPSRGHPVRHRSGPVRAVRNTRTRFGATQTEQATGKNTEASPVRRGVRSPANSRASGKATPPATNVQRAVTSRGVRAVPNNARSL